MQPRTRVSEMLTSVTRPGFEGMLNSSSRPSFSGHNRSFISTSFNPMDSNTVEDLKSSRIANLPNRKKINLGENLAFVVVFQTIEIERLSAEVESNRVKIKDFQRQIFNASNYQVQIRELTEKCFSYENERESYLEEIQKLNMICRQLYSELEDMKRKYSEVDLTIKSKFEAEKTRNAELVQEIEKWKARYMASEKSKSKELEDLRLMMQSQRKSMVDRQMRELTLKFQAQRGNLQNQIRKLRQTLEYRNRQIQQLKQRIQKQDMVINQLRRHEQTIESLENKLTMVSQQMFRLNDILKNMRDQLEAARQREYKYQQQLKEQAQWEFENKQLRNNLDNRVREIEEWKIRSSKLEEELLKNREVARLNQELSMKLAISEKQINKLNDLIRDKLDEIEHWKQRLAKQQAETNKYRNLETDIINYQNKLSVLTAEIQRLNNVLKNRLSENEELKRQVAKLQQAVNQYGLLQRDNVNLQDNLQNANRITQQLKNKITRLEQELTNMRLLERRLEETDKKNIILNSEIDRLNNILKSKVQEIQDFKIRYTKLENMLVQYKNSELRIQELTSKLELMTQQAERLNNLLRTKNEQIEKLTVRIKNLESQVSFLKEHELKLQEAQKNILNLTASLNDTKRIIEKEQEKFKNLEGRYAALEAQLFTIQQEKQKLSNSLKQKNFQYEDLKNKYSRIEQEIQRLMEIEAAFHEAKSQLVLLTSEIERISRIYQELSTDIENQRTLTTQLAFKVIVLSSEVERHQLLDSNKSKQYGQLQQEFYAMQRSAKEKQNQVMVLQTRITNIQNNLTFLKSELERYLVIIQAHQTKSREMEAEITGYQDYARRIQILSNEIDRLVVENKGLQQDIAKMRLRYSDNITFEKKHQTICLQFVLLFAEIQSLRGRVAEKEFQFEEMRKSYLQPIRNLKPT